MKKKYVLQKAPVDAPTYPVGTRVVIQRPHLWAGCAGEIVAVDDGLHRIKIDAKPDGSVFSNFHTEAYGNYLEVDL